MYLASAKRRFKRQVPTKTGNEDKILVYYDPVFLEHDTGNHPENASRLLPAIHLLNSLGTDTRVIRPNWQPVTHNEVRLVHTDRHIQSLREFVSNGAGSIEQDTVVCPASFDVALMAAGAVSDAVKRIDRGENQTAFCLVRPPGHHASSDRVAGFCLFNNVAIGARVATKLLGYDRVLIVDWDVHHGDGTQAIFLEDPSVGYFSIHRDSFYPFTGSSSETGNGAGRGTTQNLPIRFGTSRQDQFKKFETELLAFAERIRPQFVFISAGFDAHKDDPIGSLGLEAADFASMTQTVLEIASEFADGKVVSVLEGGYQPESVAACIEQHLGVLVESLIE